MNDIKTAVIHRLPRMLGAGHIERLLKLSSSSGHHDSDGDGGHHKFKPEERRFRAKKPYHLPWLAELIYAYVPRIELGSLTACGVDHDMQIYRLPEGNGQVPRHLDEDFTVPDGSLALYSILIYLNGGYVGGETVFNTTEMAPHVEVGAGLLFKHDIPHEGLVVLNGEKVVLKTDLLFRQDSGQTVALDPQSLER